MYAYLQFLHEMSLWFCSCDAGTTSKSPARKVSLLSSNDKRVTNEKINIGHCYKADCKESVDLDSKCYCCIYDGTCWKNSNTCENKCKGKIL